MEFLSKITVTCFAASYLVALICEISRLFFRLPVRWAVMFGFGLAGLFAHGVYLVLQTNWIGGGNSPLVNWSSWCLLVAFLLVVAYLWSTYRHPNAQIGLFILPPGLALIGLAELMRETPGFNESNARTIWNSLHGGFLLLATVSMFLGFVMGLMYLFQSIRLKQKIKGSRFKLPSLEWLQKSTEKTLVLSTILMGFGVLTGFVINVINRDNAGGTVKLSDPIVWSSFTMFGWCLAASLISRFYRPARGGRKMAYLAFSCFLFLILVLALVISTSHGSSRDEETSHHNRRELPPHLFDQEVQA